MKKLILILTLLAVTACGQYVAQEHVRIAEDLCKSHGGWISIKNTGTYTYSDRVNYSIEVYCKNDDVLATKNWTVSRTKND